MFKNSVIGVLVLIVLILASALVRVENQRYALSLGMCPGPATGMPPDLACIAKIENPDGMVVAPGRCDHGLITARERYPKLSKYLAVTLSLPPWHSN